MKTYSFTAKRDAYHTFTVQTNEGTKHAWKIANEKIQDHDWSNADFDTEFVDFRELNPNKDS